MIGLYKFFQVLVNCSFGFSGWSNFCFTPKMWRSSVHNILLMFCLGRGWTPRDELYGIADQLIDPGLGLHGPIGIPELSTFDVEVWMIPIVYSVDCFYVTGKYRFFEVLVNYSFSFWGWRDFCFTAKMWRSSNVLLWGRGWTPCDELYDIANQLIDPGLGLHEPIGIPKLSTFDLEVYMIFTVYSNFSMIGLYKFLQVFVNSSLGFSGWNDFCFTPKMWRSSVRNILLMFCLGHGWTPRDELYGIPDQLTDSGLGLHEPIGIPKLSTLNL